VLATRARNTAELTTKMGRYMKNCLHMQKMTNTIPMKSLTLRTLKKMENIRHKEMQFIL
jgi:hypothetical protein